MACKTTKKQASGTCAPAPSRPSKRKTVTNLLRAVQFFHPGSECLKRMINAGYMPWNTSSQHYRKFMKTDGVYLDGSIPTEATLRFWGEWEPDSKVTFLGAGSPTQQHEPFLHITKTGNVTVPAGALNTDPYVFDQHFYYSLCQQTFQNGPTLMPHLDKGSLILFGSHKHDASGPYFALDTVFVVGDYRDYTEKTYRKDLAGFIPQYYDIIRQFNPQSTVQYRCYKGASFCDSVDGMYSFVPCKLADAPKFERVRLTASINSQLSVTKTQGRKILVFNNPSQIKELWTAVKGETLKQGYLEGIEFKF